MVGHSRIALTFEEMKVMEEVFNSPSHLERALITGLGDLRKLQAIENLETDECISVRWETWEATKEDEHGDPYTVKTLVAFVQTNYPRDHYRMT